MLDDATASEVQQTLASNLRRLRIARHLSLSELARATNTSKATLSGIENARANPTVETLAALANALRIPMRELLEELPLGDIRVVRCTRSPPEQHGAVAVRALDSLAGASGALELTEIALPARTLHEVERQPPGSRAHVYVIGGKLLAGPVERVTELAPGDYASFPTDVPHVYETERQAARALLLAPDGTGR